MLAGLGVMGGLGILGLDAFSVLRIPAALAWGNYDNGRIPLSALTPVQGSYLKPDAATAFNSLAAAFRTRFNKGLSLTEGYRDFAQQQYRYQLHQSGQGPTAATPGTSNHGWATAVDLGSGVNNAYSTEFIWMRSNAPDYGWNWPQGWAEAAGEFWHWEFIPTTTPPVALARSAITATRNNDGRLQFLVVGGDGNIYTKYQTATNGMFNPSVAAYAVLPANAKDVATAISIDGRIELFYVDADGTAKHRAQTAPNSTFGAIDGFGGTGFSAAITAASNADHRLEFFVLGGDRKIYNKRQTVPNGAFGTTWTVIAASADAEGVATATSTDGRIELFYVATDGSLRHRAQTAPNGAFGNESNFGGNLSGSLSAERNADGRVEVFAVGTNGTVYSKSQTVPNGSMSTTWNLIASNARDIASVVSIDNRIELFYVATTGSVRHRAQVAPNGAYGVEEDFGGNFRH